jgi:4-amino-4-deoxy-L-arabinose transferase-like glycosyltransferase
LAPTDLHESVDEPVGDPPAADPRRSPLTTAQKRWLVAILGVATIARVWWFFATKTTPPTEWFLEGDQFGYWYYGNEIADGRGYVHYVTGEPTAYYPVGFPLLLAILFTTTGWLTSDQVLVVGLFHVVTSVAMVACTFVVGRRMLGVPGGLVAAAVLAAWPNMIFQVGSIQLETSATFLAMAALAVLVDHDWASGPPGRNRLLAFGVLLAVGAMVRPFAVLVLVGLLAALLLTRIGWVRALKLVAWPVLVLVLVFIPWTIRNAVQLGTFAPSSTNVGDGLCLDRYEHATGGYRWSDHEGCADVGLSEATRNQQSTRKAISWIIHNPQREIIQWGRRAQFMFESDFDGVQAVAGMGDNRENFDPELKQRLMDLSNSYFAAMLWLAVPGVFLAWWRSPRPQRWLFGSMFVSLLAFPLSLYGNPRFHVPLTPFGSIGVAASVLTVVGAVAAVAGRRREPVTAAPSMS